MEKKTNVKHCDCKVKHCKVCKDKCIEYHVAKKLLHHGFTAVGGGVYVQV